jgi:hypothetical protein
MLRRRTLALRAALLVVVVALGACGPRIATPPRLHPTLQKYRDQRATRPASDPESQTLDRELADASDSTDDRRIAERESTASEPGR